MGEPHGRGERLIRDGGAGFAAWGLPAAAVVLLALLSSSGCFVTAATWHWAAQPVDATGYASRSTGQRLSRPDVGLAGAAQADAGSRTRTVKAASGQRKWPSRPRTPEARRKRIFLATALTPVTVACDVVIAAAIIGAIAEGGDLSSLDFGNGGSSSSGSSYKSKAERDRALEAKRRALEKKRGARDAARARASSGGRAPGARSYGGSRRSRLQHASWYE